MKYIKLIIITLTLFLTSSAYALTFDNQSIPYSTFYNNDRPLISWPTNTSFTGYNPQEGHTIESVTFHNPYTENTYLDTTPLIWRLMTNYNGTGQISCESTPQTLTQIGFVDLSQRSHTSGLTSTINFTGNGCTFDNTFDYNQTIYIGAFTTTNTFVSDDSSFRLGSSGNNTVGNIHFVVNYNDGTSTQNDLITLNYPQENQSISSPVSITGTYENTGIYDQFGIELLYNDENENLVSDFVWYSIPEQTATEIPFSYAINTVSDQVYSMILSLNDSDGTDTYISAQFDFDTLSLLPPDPYTDEFDCGLTDIGCNLRSAFAWAFIPSSQTLNNFSTLTLSDKAPISYIYEISDLFDTLTDQTLQQDFEMQVSTPIGNITFINQQMIDDVPFLPFMRLILTALVYFLGAWTLYAIARRIF